MEAGFANGTLVQVGGLYATSCRTEFRVRAGEVTSTDGPFTEAKEEVGGFAIIDVRDHAEAVENARRMAELHATHWPEWTGAVEAAWRRESAALVAALTRMTRDVGAAEDLAQDALVAALEQWPAPWDPE